VKDKLTQRYAQEGPLSEQEVSEAVERASDELRDAPVQTFVPLIAENKARNELQERAHDQESGEE
jgi:hypothetical protein